MNAIWSLLAQHGVDLVLTGHDHSYQRWVPLDAAGAASPTGVTQFVVGTGGHGIQNFVRSDSRLAIGVGTEPNGFGALRLELNQDGAAYRFVNAQGLTLDSGSVACSGAPPDTRPPSAPTNLIATSSSSAQVDLTWSAATDNVGVVAYEIYRNGILLTTSSSATGYADTTVTAGTVYEYQVRARDAAGNVSAFSNLATLIPAAGLFNDGFESGSLAQWTSVTNLTVQQQEIFAGSFAARGTSSGVATYAYKQLSATQNELYYRIYFEILSQVQTMNLLKFRTSTGSSILAIFVSNNGYLGYRNDAAGVTSFGTTPVARGIWHELQAHALINGAASQTEIWLDGTKITDLSKTDNFGTTPIGRIQLGENLSGISYDVAFDNVAVDTHFITSSDIIAPNVTLTTPADGAAISRSVILAADATDNMAVDHVDFLINNAVVGTDSSAPYSVNWDSASIGDGSATITARAVDTAANVTTSTSRTVTVDNTAPDTTIDTGLAGITNSNSASFSFAATEPGATFACGLDGASLSTCSSPTSYTGLADGAHTFVVQATDTAGNTDPTPASRGWTVDTIAPDTTITSGQTGSVNSNSASFSFTATEAGSTFICSLDGAAFSTCTSPRSYVNLANGSHSFQVKATDAAGNTDATSASRIWTIDTIAPTIAISVPANGAALSGQVTITAVASDNVVVVRVRFYVDGVLLNTDTTAPYSTTWNTKKSTKGSHTLYAEADDAAGNTTRSASIAVTVR